MAQSQTLQLQYLYALNFYLMKVLPLMKGWTRPQKMQGSRIQKQWLKSAILAIFQKGPRWPCPVSAALKNSNLKTNAKTMISSIYISMHPQVPQGCQKKRHYQLNKLIEVWCAKI